MVIGVSLEARGTLDFRIEIDAGFAGASLQVFASVSFGARMIGIVDLDNPALLTPLPALAIAAFYGRVHVAIEVELTVKAWVGAGPFKFKGRVSAGVSVTVSAEIGYNGPTAFGMRGEATVAFRVMGKRLGITVGVGFGEENVRAVIDRVSPYEKMGLEGGDFSETEEPPNLLAGATAFSRLQQFDDANGFVVLGGDMELRLETPHYTVFLIHRPEQEWSHFVLFPGAEPDPGGVRTDRGFLPFPPAGAVDHDFRVFFPAPVEAGFELEQFCPTDAATGGA